MVKNKKEQRLCNQNKRLLFLSTLTAKSTPQGAATCYSFFCSYHNNFGYYTSVV